MATTTPVASWGVSGSVSAVSGIVSDLEVGKTGVMAPEQNELGQIINQTMYDVQITIRATVLVAAATDAPEPGTAATIDGITCYVRDARVVESNRDYRKITIEAEAYEHCSAITDRTA